MLKTHVDSSPAVAIASDCEAAARDGCHVAWWAHFRYLVDAALLPCRPALALSSPARRTATASCVRGTLFLPSAGDRRVHLFLHDHEFPPGPRPAQLLVLDLPAGLGGDDIAAAGRLVLECQQEWAGRGALLEAPMWLVYCNGRRVGFAGRREMASEAEGWVLEKLWAVSAGAGRLPGGGVEYLRGRFERVVGSSDAESFHLVEPIGWLGINGGGTCGGLSIFFHRV